MTTARAYQCPHSYSLNGLRIRHNITEADIIGVTHGHSDHLGNAIELEKRTGAVLVPEKLIKVRASNMPSWRRASKRGPGEAGKAHAKGDHRNGFRILFRFTWDRMRESGGCCRWKTTNGFDGQ